MRIAQIAPISLPVPPRLYGGTERVISSLTEELVKRGHEVTLFASGDSHTQAQLVSVVPHSLTELNTKDAYGLNELTLLNIGLAYEHQKEFDIIHDHATPMSIPLANITSTPTVVTMHRTPTDENKKLYESLSNLNLVTISQAQEKIMNNSNVVGTIYNGLSMEQYPFGATHKNYLMFVGRISMEKGTHFAIETAKKLNMQLLMAAKLDDVEIPYFKKYIQPHLKDKRIQWLGEVDDKERNQLMASALCVLHPVTWPEPFGLSMIEAMACGAPVIAFNKGSIPEVIQDKKSGFIVNTVPEMVAAVKKIPTIKRAYTREYSISTFNAKRMADGYEALYNKVIYYSSQRRRQEEMRHSFAFSKNKYIL